MEKVSIRFYNDHLVRAVWSEEQGEWFFAIVDIVAAITLSEAPRKYWSVLKTRLKKQGNELATNCSQLKLLAADGKRYNTDCIPMSKVAELAKAHQATAQWQAAYNDLKQRALKAYNNQQEQIETLKKRLGL